MAGLGLSSAKLRSLTANKYYKRSRINLSTIDHNIVKIYQRALKENMPLVMIKPYDHMPKNYVRVGLLTWMRDSNGYKTDRVLSIALLMPRNT